MRAPAGSLRQWGCVRLAQRARREADQAWLDAFVPLVWPNTIALPVRKVDR